MCLVSPHSHMLQGGVESGITQHLPFFFSSRRRHTRLQGDWSSDVCSSDLLAFGGLVTHAAISVMGIVLALIAGVGWWREVFPEQRVERITLRTIELRPPTVMPDRKSVV